MNIWIVQTGEAIPIKDINERPYRMGMLVQELLKLNDNINIIWWTSTIKHSSKTLIEHKDAYRKITDNFQIRFLHGPLYKKNISIKRLLNHYIVSKKFKKLSKKLIKPDVIISSLPTIQLSKEVVRYAKTNNVPIIIDIRDLWPDVFLNAFPKILRSIARLLLFPLYKQAKYSLYNCDALIAVSPGYLKWGQILSSRTNTENDRVFPIGYKQQEQKNKNSDYIKNVINKYAIDKNKIICWFVGLFGKSYDLGPVIKAASILSDKNDMRVQFILSGDGDDYGKYIRMANGLKNIIFTGWVNKEDLYALNTIADIGLMAYKHNALQGLPNKVFEYMSTGTPILSSLQTETKDLVETNNIGLTYIHRNENDFLHQLEKLIEDTELRRTMSKNALELFKKYNSINIYPNMAKYILCFHNHFYGKNDKL